MHLLSDASAKLREAGIDTPILDAELLLTRAAGISRTRMMMHPELVPPSWDVQRFLGFVKRRVEREPLAYITGEREFYGLLFDVTSDVLIPRQDTEILVETAVKMLSGIEHPTVADVGLGSGAIAISVAKTIPTAVVFGTESSAPALEIARRNAERHGVLSQVRFLCGDLLEPLKNMNFDLIVSNPPYIPSADIDKLQPEVARFEPRQALDGGPDGLDAYRRLVVDAPPLLHRGGILAVEIGIGEDDPVSAMFKAHGLTNIRVIPDYAGLPRVVTGVRW
jgi:release factor glutamine methyltransferase